MIKHVLFGAVLLLTGSQSAPQVGPSLPVSPAPASREINFFSHSQDIEIGTQSSEEAEKQLALIRDAPLNQYLRSIAQRLLPHTAPRQFRYRLQLVNSDDINSLGFPNGAIYLYRGLLTMAASEDEVAAIIAHEIGHISLRHPTSQLSRQLLVQAPISISAGLPTMSEWRDQLTRLGVVFGVNAPFLHYSRDLEVEAVAAAEQLLTLARFDPHALAGIFQKIATEGRRDDLPAPVFLYNHRMPETAVQPESESETLRTAGPAAKPARTGADFRSFRAALDKLPKPIVEEAAPTALPEESLPNLFTHPEGYYRLNYPEGWQLRRTGNGAIIAPPDGIRTSPAGDDVTLGVMFDIFDTSTLERTLTLEQATSRLIVQLRQRNQTVRAVPGAQTPTLIHDTPGLRTVLLRGGLVRSGNANLTETSEVLWLVSRMYYQNLFYMIFVAPEEEFPAYQQIFEQMVRSVQVR